MLLVGTQYFRDDAGVLQGGGVPQTLSFVRDDLPQEPPHDFSRPSFWKTFHYLARKGCNIRISGGARIPSQRPTALRKEGLFPGDREAHGLWFHPPTIWT